MVQKMGSKARFSMHKILDTLCARRLPADLSTSSEGRTLGGYVLKLSPRLVLIHTINNQLKLDGMSVIPIEDISRIVPDPDDGLINIITQVRGQVAGGRSLPPIQNLGQMLESFAKSRELVAVHFGRVDPEVCFVGLVVKVGKEQFRFRKVDSEGRWYVRESVYRIANLTRVSFGDHYLEALELVLKVRGDTFSSTSV